MPTPVIVTVEPEIVAGPETTEYAIAPGEFDVAATVNGASPYVWFGTVKVMVGAEIGLMVTWACCELLL